MKRTIVLISSIVIALMISLPVYAMEILGGAGAGASTGNSYSVSGSATKQEVQAKQSISCKVPLTDIGDASKKIKDGVYVGTINISGMTQEEALNAVNNYVAELSGTEIGLICVSGNTVNVHAYDLGLTWTDTGIIDDAISLGRSGNVIKRFKEIADLKRSNKVYELKLNADEEKIRQVITDECKKYDVEAKNSTLTRENGEFKVTPGRDGLTVNVDESVKLVTEKLMSISSASPLVVSLILDESKPKGDADTLGKLTDVLGTFTTKFTNSGKDRVTNVSNGCRLVNGTLLYPGEQISISETISPMTEENGYALAGSYLNGRVVESFGGGICQVSTTLYQAVLRAELQVDERYNHSMVVNYVDHSGDAAIAEGIKDFKFTNNLENPIYIEGYTSPEKTITFTIYGVETRPSNRTLEFESVDLEEIVPEGEQIVADSSMAAGSTRKQSAHIGYRSELYKIVKVDGTETERVLINKSKYNAVPAILTVGTNTEDPTVKAIINEAIATQNIEQCKAIIAGQAAPPSAVQAAEAQQAAALAAIIAAQQSASQQTGEADPPD